MSGTALGGAAEAGATVSIFDLSTRLGTTVSNGGWSFLTGTAPTDTPHIYTATATDIAGNISAILGSAQLGSSAVDTLTSTSGNDLMTGGAGADTFAFLADFANDTITDFSGQDIVNFHQNAVLADWTSVRAHMVQAGANVVISQNANNSLTLLNTQKSALTESNFTFV